MSKEDSKRFIKYVEVSLNTSVVKHFSAESYLRSICENVTITTTEDGTTIRGSYDEIRAIHDRLTRDLHEESKKRDRAPSDSEDSTSAKSRLPHFFKSRNKSKSKGISERFGSSQGRIYEAAKMDSSSFAGCSEGVKKREAGSMSPMREETKKCRLSSPFGSVFASSSSTSPPRRMDRSPVGRHLSEEFERLSTSGGDDNGLPTCMVVSTFRGPSTDSGEPMGMFPGQEEFSFVESNGGHSSITWWKNENGNEDCNGGGQTETRNPNWHHDSDPSVSRRSVRVSEGSESFVVLSESSTSNPDLE